MINFECTFCVVNKTLVYKSFEHTVKIPNHVYRKSL